MFSVQVLFAINWSCLGENTVSDYWVNACLSCLSQWFPPSLSFQMAIGRVPWDVRGFMRLMRFGRVRDAAFMKVGRVVPETWAHSLKKCFFVELGNVLDTVMVGQEVGILLLMSNYLHFRNNTQIYIYRERKFNHIFF